jgi:hypothetical protein
MTTYVRTTADLTIESCCYFNPIPKATLSILHAAKDTFRTNSAQNLLQGPQAITASMDSSQHFHKPPIGFFWEADRLPIAFHDPCFPRVREIASPWPRSHL